MDHSLGVSVIQCITYLSDDTVDLRQRQRVAVQQVSQGPALDKWHNDVGIAIDFAIVMNRENVRVQESSKDLGLLLEASQELWITGEVARQNLKGDIPVHTCLVCLVNYCHAPLAQRRDNTIRTKLFTSEVFQVALSCADSRQIRGVQGLN